MGDCDDLCMRTQRLIADRYSLVKLLPGSATGIGWRAVSNRSRYSFTWRSTVAISGLPR